MANKNYISVDGLGTYHNKLKEYIANQLTSYYLKTETYTKEEVDGLVSAIPKFKIEVVDALPTEGISSTTVYLLKTSETETGNLYTEYIYINDTWEKLGTQELDISGKMDKENPTGSGSLSIGREKDSTIGKNSAVIGDGCSATAESSVAVGYYNVASGFGAFAEGGENSASGAYSHVEGDSSESSGQFSHAEGNSTQSLGEGSHSEGISTISHGDYQHVQGKYNIEDTENKYADIVGGGSDGDTRKNIETLDWNGNLTVSGDMTATKTDGTTVSVTNLSSQIASSLAQYDMEFDEESGILNLTTRS